MQHVLQEWILTFKNLVTTYRSVHQSKMCIFAARFMLMRNVGTRLLKISLAIDESCNE